MTLLVVFLATVTDPVGRTASYTYDPRGRTTVVTYDDDSTERYFYGANGSGDENLLVKSVDRRGVVTNYEYDDSGRKTRTVHAAAVMDAAGSESPVSDPSVTVEETLTYLNGTNLVATRTRAGELTVGWHAQ